MLCSGATAKIAQFPVVVSAKNHIFWLQISVGYRWILHVQMEKTFDYVRRNFENHSLFQASLSLFNSHLNHFK